MPLCRIQVSPKISSLGQQDSKNSDFKRKEIKQSKESVQDFFHKTFCVCKYMCINIYIYIYIYQ